MDRRVKPGDDKIRQGFDFTERRVIAFFFSVFSVSLW